MTNHDSPDDRIADELERLTSFIETGMDEIHGTVWRVLELQQENFKALAEAVKTLSEQVEVVRTVVEGRRENAASVSPDGETSTRDQSSAQSADTAVRKSGFVERTSSSDIPNSPKERLF